MDAKQVANGPGRNSEAVTPKVDLKPGPWVEPQLPAIDYPSSPPPLSLDSSNGGRSRGVPEKTAQMEHVPVSHSLPSFPGRSVLLTLVFEI